MTRENGNGTFRPPQSHSSNARAQPSSGDRSLILSLNLRLVLYYICAKVLVRLRGCAFADPSLFAYSIRSITPYAVSNNAQVS